jgi:CRP-like cAMP-binding protein
MSFFELLKTVPMFSGLSDRELSVIESMLEIESYRSGQIIIRQEEVGRSLYVIVEGAVSITRTTPEGQRIEMAEVRRGEVLGELSALDAGPRSADATAIQDCQLLALHREKFLMFVQHEPQAAVTLMVNLLATLSQRLRRTDEILYENEVSRLQEWNEQIDRATTHMKDMNSAFQETLSRRFEIIFAYRDLIGNVERLSDIASALARGSNADLGPGMSDLASELRSLAASARLQDTN